MSDTTLSPLPKDRREALIALEAAEGLPALISALQAVRARGVDVAGLPWRLLDRRLGAGGPADPDGMARLAAFLPGGQPRLWRAICDGLSRGDQAALAALRVDASTHRMTRWEATTWAVFLRHRAPAQPADGKPVPRLMQFWDRNLPPDLVDPVAAWAHVAAGLEVEARLYSEGHAARFIGRVAGEDAARDFRKLWHGAVKSDIFRLFWLLHTGGAYVDADSLPGLGAGRFLAQAGGGHWAASLTRLPHAPAINGFLLAPKGSPLIAAFLERALAAAHDRPKGPIFWLTGPGAFTQMLWEGDWPIRLLPEAALRPVFRQIEADYKQTTRNWRLHEADRGLKDGKELARLFPQPYQPGA